MSDKQGVLCFMIHVVAAVVAGAAVIAGSFVTAGIGLVVYMVSGALVIRYIAS